MHFRKGSQLSPAHPFIVSLGVLAILVLSGCGAPHLTYLTVTPDRSSIALGGTETFKVTANYSDGTTADVTASAAWNSSNPSIATISNGGVANSVAVGSATITAIAEGKNGTASLTVSKAALTGISVTSPSSAIALGQTAQFKAEGTYTDKSVQDITDQVSWSAANPTVAAISAAGLAVAKAVGATQVTASLNNINGSGQISVSAPALASLAVRSKDASVSLGESEQFSAIGTYTDGSTADLTGTASWSSSAPAVVSINAAGLASTKGTGTVSITAAVGGISGVTAFAVSAAGLVSIAVSGNSSALPLGDSEQLTATGTYTDKSTKDLTGSVTWTSSAPGVIAISSGGAIQAKSVGLAGVSATSSNITGSLNVNVSAATLVSIAVSASQSSLPIGTSEQLTATGTYTDKSKKDLTGSVTWTSSAPGVIAISSAGTAQAKSVGSAGVSATSSNITGSLNVNVSAATLASIAISASHSSLPVGTSEQLTATGTYTDKSTKDITGSVTWTSSAPGVVAITSGGTVQAKSVGSAGVSAVSASVTGSTNLSVSPAVLVGISIAANSESVPVGDTLQLSAVGTLTDGSTQDLTASVSWTSSSPNVLGIRGAGLVAGISMGAAGVTASSGSISTVKNLNVSAAVLSSVALAPTSPMVPLGSSLQLAVTGTYSDGSTQDVTQQVTWNIDDATVAAVTPGGMVSGLQVGSTGIEASLDGTQASGTLTVEPLLAMTYFDATSGTDSTIRISNPGTTGQDLCTMIYVFDWDQQMSECCGCIVFQDGLLSLSLKQNLLSNPLTGVASTSGTVVLVSAQEPSNGGCNASSMTPTGTVVAWATHLPQSNGAMSSAEVPFSVSTLSTTLLSSLQAQCSFIQQLGSGQGVCGCGYQP